MIIAAQPTITNKNGLKTGGRNITNFDRIAH